MGNTLGHHKQENKLQRDRTCEKETEKKQKQQKTGDKKDVRKQNCNYPDSDVDGEIDESSHVTGGDSESCLFQSAENIFVDPPSSRRLHELNSEWSFNQHPQIVSSQDFQDGFSLEACIPPEIARSEVYNDTTTRGGAYVDRFTVTASCSTPRPEIEATSGPLRSVPSTTHTKSLNSPPLTPLLEREAGSYKSLKLLSSSTSSSCHHPHFYNHHSDRKYQRSGDLAQHPSPQAQKNQSSKIAKSPCKLTSFTSPTSHTPTSPTSHTPTSSIPNTPTSPTPHRRAANFLALFRKVDVSLTSDNEDTAGQADRSYQSSNDEFKVKSKPMWKTWERPRSLKSQPKMKVSIFGTFRKKEKNVEVVARDAVRENVKQETVNVRVSDRSWSDSSQTKSGSNVEIRRHESFRSAPSDDQQEGKGIRHRRSGPRTTTISSECGEMSGRESQHLSQTAAVCIMKLEELERSIERTIRDKFPDGESFLLRKRSNEELRGSRSLPTTPSLKKKLYITRDEEEGNVKSRISDHKGVTRFCDETYESPPSPAKSPVILRRFGARTRHASISPKLARAKTALLFNSPSELSGFAPSTGKSKKAECHSLSIHQISGQTHRLHGLLSTAHKSESKYDNVSDAGTPDSCCPLHQDWPSKDSMCHAVKTVPVEDNINKIETTAVIRPTFSAVFGSVSPKLRRHNLYTVDGVGNHRHNLDTVDDRPSTIVDKETTFAYEGSCSRSDSDNDTRFANKRVTFVKSQGRSRDMEPPVTQIQSLENRQENEHHGTQQKYITRDQGTDNVRSTSTTHHESCVRTFPGTESMSEQPISMNRSMLWARVDSESDVDINRDEKAGNEEELRRHTAGKSGTGRCVPEVPKQHTRNKFGTSIQKKPGREQFSVPARAENVASTKPPHVCSETKVDKLHSTDIVREKSTDHTVLITALAKRASTSPSPQSSSELVKANTSHTQHAQDEWSQFLDSGSCCEGLQASVVSQQAAFVSQQVSAVRQQKSTKVKRAEIKDLSTPTRQVEHDGVTKNDPLLSRDVVFLEQDDATEVSSCQGQSVPACTRQSNLVLQNKSPAVPSTFLASCPCPLTRQDELAGELTSVKNNSKNQRDVNSEKHRSLQESEKRHYRRSQDAETVTVLKQPVSEVISQMINQSQRLSQQQVHLSQQQQQINISQQQQQHGYICQQQEHMMSQTGLILPDCVSADTKCDIGTVKTSPNDEQPCQTLEHKVTVVDLKSPRNLGHDVRQTCSSVVVTDANTIAEHSAVIKVNSPDEATPCAGKPVFLSRPTGDTGQVEGDKMKELRETGNLSENEFLERVLAGSGIETRSAAGVHTASDHVPPPSPTVIHQLMEDIFEDSKDGDDANDEATSLKKESDMKQFTDIVYKRLSDLLDGRSGRQVTVQSHASTDVSLELSHEAKSHQKNGSAESRDEAVDDTENTSTTAATRSSANSVLKVLTIESSSSLTTTTSSDSDIDEPVLVFKHVNNNGQDDLNKDRAFVRKNFDPSALDFRELDIDVDRQSRDSDKRRDSREYHSDDDVATGRGIPDYYDDRPLWSRRQKPPGQLSETMMAVRWRERRERWLKKRRRNRTELLSTGSSDNNETCSTRDCSLLPESVDCFEVESYKTRTTCTNDMGSAILTSPKYTKPILPFLYDIQTWGSERPLKHPPRPDNGCRPLSHVKHGQCSSQELETDYRHAHEEVPLDDYNEHISGEVEQHGGLDMAAPVIEDTFQELTSVHDILVRMEELRPSVNDDNQGPCLPLTTENVRSIREYYKDYCLTGGGRRSRLSATDRTESDLDIYSEMPDDASSGSELYADDEGDDDAPDLYTTADDGLKASVRASKRDNGCHGEGKTSSDTSVVISCTFYNSSSQPGSRCEQNEVDETASSQRSTSGGPRIPSCNAGLNSDEEFWTGSAAAMEDSYRQLETAADAVSSTFQNARVQMHDIQYHLQALRRQMEVMQDDLTNISMTLNPNTSVQHPGN